MSLLSNALEGLKGRRVVFIESGAGFIIKPGGLLLENQTVIDVDDSGLKTDKGNVYALSAIAAVKV
jgi:hypothetical protein